MELLNTFGSDIKKSEEGVWITLSDRDGESGRLKIARLWNPRFKELFRKYTEEVTNNTGSPPTEEEQDTIMAKCLAGAILVDWENIKVNGKEYAYSVSNAIDILLKPELVDFKDRVVSEATKFSNFRLENLQQISEK